MSFNVAKASLQPIAQIEYRNLFLKVLPSLGFIFCLTIRASTGEWIQHVRPLVILTIRIKG